MLIGKKDALIIVDPQNDFCDGGALAVPGGSSIMESIRIYSQRFAEAGATIVITQDWHPQGHKSFASSWYMDPYAEVEMPYGMQTLWPDHCVQGTDGADFHPDIPGGIADVIIRKGMNREIDSYSAFVENDKVTKTGLAGYLRDKGVTRVFLVGLAYDFCVGFSALDARSEGFGAFVIKSLTKSIAIPVENGTTETIMDQRLADAGVVATEFVPNLEIAGDAVEQA